MATYVITGVSKGIGFEFVKQISTDPTNLVIGLVRDKIATEQRIRSELGERTNVHILQADLTKYDDLKRAAQETAKVAGGRGVDYLVANAGYVGRLDAYGPIGALADKPGEVEAYVSTLVQTNVVGNVHLFNLFLPLVLKSNVKKVITITSGMADLDFINDLEVAIAPYYSASKAMMNAIVAKFNAQYKNDGVLFLGISPGLVDTGHYADATPEDLQGFAGLTSKLAEYAPDFKGPITPEESVQHVRATWERASIETGFGGAFVSHFGNKRWV